MTKEEFIKKWKHEFKNDNSEEIEMAKDLDEVIKMSKKTKRKQIKPTIELITDFFNSEGYLNKDAETFYKYYYSDADGTDKNNNAVLNWKQKARVVWFPKLVKQKQEIQKEYKNID